MANKGYHSYRGRRKGGKSIFLLLLILVLACGFIYLQRFITYSDDGSIQFDLPFLEKEVTEVPDEPVVPDEKPEMDLIVDQGGSAETEKPDKVEPVPQPAPQPVAAEYHLKGLAALPTDSAALEAELTLAGANGFVYTVRDNTGRVFYDSVAALRSAVNGAATATALQGLCALEDTVSVAKLNAFHDSYYAWANMESAGICQSTGHIWYDNLSYHWLEPEKEKAREYVISLAVECAQMGFDQILLEDMCYPSSGNLYKIDYTANSMAKPDALALFLTELKMALEPYGTGVALLADERALDAAANAEYVQNSGQDLARLASLVDAVYVNTADAAAAEAALAAAVGEEEPPVLVPVAAAAAPAGNWYIP